ncbi:MAG TPA: hypothetical protein VGM11_10385 [Acidobacteriaceae bacterium]
MKSSLTPPPTGAAKLIPTSRRYRGLHLVSDERLLNVSLHLNRLAQTQAIVAQVEREVAQRALRERDQPDLVLLNPVTAGPSLPSRAVRRCADALFPKDLAPKI